MSKSNHLTVEPSQIFFMGVRPVPIWLLSKCCVELLPASSWGESIRTRSVSMSSAVQDDLQVWIHLAGVSFNLRRRHWSASLFRNASSLFVIWAHPRQYRVMGRMSPMQATTNSQCSGNVQQLLPHCQFLI